jgi:hypothetical protein
MTDNFKAASTIAESLKDPIGDALKTFSAVRKTDDEFEQQIAWLEELARVYPQGLGSDFPQRLCDEVFPIKTQEDFDRGLKIFGVVAQALMWGPGVVPDSWIDDIGKNIQTGSYFHERAAALIAKYCPERLRYSLLLPAAENATDSDGLRKGNDDARRAKSYETVNELFLCSGRNFLSERQGKIAKADADSQNPDLRKQAEITCDLICKWDAGCLAEAKLWDAKMKAQWAAQKLSERNAKRSHRLWGYSK